jgi:hypothetical protein
MRIPLASTTVSRLIGAAAALWLLCAGPAWAGAGGSDAVSFLTNILCPILGLSPPPAVPTTCPSFDTLTKTVLEIAALEPAPPEIVRAANSIVPTVAVNAVNPPAGEPTPGTAFPILENLTPLAFISSMGSGGTVTATQLGNGAANSYFYAATDGVLPSIPGTTGTAPTTLYVVYDYPPLTNPAAATAAGKDLADICLPLTVLSGHGTSNVAESPLPTLLRVINASSPPVVAVGSCSGNGSGAPMALASDLGLGVTLTSKSTPNSAAKHAVIEVQIKLLVTMATDPTYFGIPTIFNLFREPIFINEELGSTPTINVPGIPKLPIGMSPVATQFTANIAGNFGGGQNSQGQSTVVSLPAVNATLAISIDGETLVSAPLP